MNPLDILLIASIVLIALHFLIYAAYSRLRRDVDRVEKRINCPAFGLKTMRSDLDVFAKEYKENRAKVEERLRRLENTE